jgi:hypothetical protein
MYVRLRAVLKEHRKGLVAAGIAAVVGVSVGAVAGWQFGLTTGLSTIAALTSSLVARTSSSKRQGVHLLGGCELTLISV